MAEISETNISNQHSKSSRPLIEFAPLFLFFVTNYFAGIFWGTFVLIVATIISLGVIWHLDRRIPIIAAFGCVAVAFFGGLTLIFEDEFFIKIKPTVISGLFALVILAAQMLGKQPMKVLLGKQISLTTKGWKYLALVWVSMFIVTAIANEIAWRTLSTDSWVSFKAFGLTGISLFFAIISVPVMTKFSEKTE